MPETDFSKTIIYKIEQLSIYVQTQTKNFFESRNVDLTQDEFGAMNFIINNPNICQRDLAKLILRDRVRTGRIITSLEKKGYIKRTNNTKNNRLVRTLSITASGKKIYDEQFTVMSEIYDKVLAKFPEGKMTELCEMLSELQGILAEVVKFNI